MVGSRLGGCSWNPIPSGSRGGQASTCSYVGDNPVSYTDPFGLTQCDIDTARAIAAAANLQLSSGQTSDVSEFVWKYESRIYEPWP